jgi:hypothetical protein
LEKDPGLFASFLFGLRVDKGAFSIVTDVLFNLIFIENRFFMSVLTLHHILHGRELVIGEG